MTGTTNREKLCSCYNDVVAAMVDAHAAYSSEMLRARKQNRLGCIERYAATVSKLAETLEEIRVALTEFV